MCKIERSGMGLRALCVFYHVYDAARGGLVVKKENEESQHHELP